MDIVSYYQFSRITQCVIMLGLCLYLISLCASVWVREILAIVLGLLVFCIFYRRLKARAQARLPSDVASTQMGASSVGFLCTFALFSGVMIFFGVSAAYL
jgi:hypothetical protein